VHLRLVILGIGDLLLSFSQRQSNISDPKLNQEMVVGKLRWRAGQRRRDVALDEQPKIGVSRILARRELTRLPPILRRGRHEAECFVRFLLLSNDMLVF
jgi:hypothetical protein